MSEYSHILLLDYICFSDHREKMPYKMMGTMMSWVKQDVAESPLYALF